VKVSREGQRRREERWEKARREQGMPIGRKAGVVVDREGETGGRRDGGKKNARRAGMCREKRGGEWGARGSRK
jgi:hypothetical protein